MQELLDKGLAYKSYMTEAELHVEKEAQVAAGHLPRHVYEYEGMSEEEIRKVQSEKEKAGIPSCVRIREHKDHIYEWDDMVKGKISFLGKNMYSADWVIEKADGYPTYNFCVVIDDHLMDITHILRGDDHVNNTPKQLMVYEAFGWDVPKMGHMPLIMNAATGKKLSKRDKNTLQFIEDYRSKGFLKEAVFNFISMLGWNPGGNEELFTREELIKLFDEKRMSSAPAAFDQNKLNWINSQYVKKLSEQEFIDLCLPFMERAGRLSSETSESERARIEKIIALFHQQLQYGEQIIELTNIFFEQIDLSEKNKKFVETSDAQQVIKCFRDKLAQLPESEFIEEKIVQLIKEVSKALNINGKNLWMPLRIALSREEHGPELDRFTVLLGLKPALERLDQTILMS